MNPQLQQHGMQGGASRFTAEDHARALYVAVDQLTQCVTELREVATAADWQSGELQGQQSCDRGGESPKRDHSLVRDHDPERDHAGAASALDVDEVTAELLHRERLQLIDAWAALESEQRRQQTNTPQTKSPQAKTQSGVAPAMTTRPVNSGSAGAMEKSKQFRFLQREYDKHRE